MALLPLSDAEEDGNWNDQKYCEIWRHEWEVIQNRYLEANDRPERVDLLQRRGKPRYKIHRYMYISVL